MKRFCPLFLALLVCAGSVFSAANFAYKGKAVGAHASFIITNDYLNNNLAPGGGLQADVFFKFIGNGKFAWSPSIAVMGHSDDYQYDWNYRFHERWVQFEINPVDFKYFPPVASSLPIKPYLGLGGPAIIIHHYHTDYDHRGGYYWWHDKDEPRASAAFNFMAGVDFVFSEKAYPYIEIREQATDYNNFRITGGFNVVF